MALSRAIGAGLNRTLPFLRSIFQTESPAVRGIKERALPIIQSSGGNVVVEAQDTREPTPLRWNGNTLPRSIEMLTQNDIAVRPNLILRSFPWQDLLSTPLHESIRDENLHREIKRSYDDLVRWRELGHLVNASLAVEICKRAATALALQDMDRLLKATPTGPLGVVQEALKNNDIELPKLMQRHESIRTLLSQNNIRDAYDRAQAALSSLETVHNMLENARMRALDLQREASGGRRSLWLAGGACVVLGLACEFAAAMPGDLPSVLPVLRDTIATGAVLCLTIAAFSELTSASFGKYMEHFRTAQDARIRLKLKLEEDVNECLDIGMPLRS